MASAHAYRYIVCVIFDAPNENSRHKIRAKPLPGQWAGPEYRIECPLNIREPENIGELYKFWAKFKEPDAKQLYTSHWWVPEKLTQEQAQKFIAEKSWF
jgi:hypothetical protein